MKKLQKVLIMAGGTGGHVYPGLAIAKRLQERGVAVHWMGTRSSFESKTVPQTGLPMHYIAVGRLRGQGLLGRVAAPFRLGLAIIQALRIIKRLQPDVIIGMGGFVSGPGGIAAWLLRKPLIVHEQNAKMGLTNKWLSRVATRVLEGFPGTFPKQAKVITTGNPVRQEIAAMAAPTERMRGRKQPMHLLVLGGSLGAQALNTLVPSALQHLFLEERPDVLHQTGEKHSVATQKAYDDLAVASKVVPFIDDMQAAYTWADMVICRAGALTIAELCAAGVGAILVPFPYAVDDHQTANAGYFVTNQAGFIRQEAELTEEDLARLLKELINAPEKRVAMAEAAYALRQTQATNKVLAICEEVCQ